ncbi:hypothetical protein [Clostridium sp. MD294]|uniref:hypothetical protein n=1 Tax=Clostridium sp. MD294 TaxID=97138 RepID=UPI0003A129F6|nr:hypothetical protein [Clostridium sp. MD294]NDO47114.1 hypothetical protein [Clostridium sp. MD294]
MGKQFDVVFPLFLFAFFVFSHAEGVLQISKKFAFGVWGNTNKQGKGYPFPLLAIIAEMILYTNF